MSKPVLLLFAEQSQSNKGVSAETRLSPADGESTKRLGYKTMNETGLPVT